MREARKNPRTVYVSFSGIDGAGKSTQIDALREHLENDGLRVRVVRFWDDIARLKAIRETSGRCCSRATAASAVPPPRSSVAIKMCNRR